MGNSITIQGLSELIVKVKNLPANLNVAIDGELDSGAKSIASRAIELAPGNNGTLRQGIGSGKTGDLQYEVYSRSETSAFMEFGTGQYVEIPSGLEEFAAQFKGDFTSGTLSPDEVGLSAKEAIFHWCEQKGIDRDLWYPIYISIMTYGIHAQPFFFPAVYEKTPEILANVQKAVQEVLDR